MIECAKLCYLKGSCCKEKDCRLWLDYEEDLNCTVIASKKNPEMTYKEISKRLNISIVRAKQIHDKALQKLKQIALF